jgi:hypothetical protein
VAKNQKMISAAFVRQEQGNIRQKLQKLEGLLVGIPVSFWR